MADDVIHVIGFVRPQSHATFFWLHHILQHVALFASLFEIATPNSCSLVSPKNDWDLHPCIGHMLCVIGVGTPHSPQSILVSRLLTSTTPNRWTASSNVHCGRNS